MDLDDTTKRQRLVSGDCVRSKNVGRMMPSSTTSRLLKEHLRVEQPYVQANMALGRARTSRDAQARGFRSSMMRFMSIVRASTLFIVPAYRASFEEGILD